MRVGLDFFCNFVSIKVMSDFDYVSQDRSPRTA